MSTREQNPASWPKRIELDGLKIVVRAMEGGDREALLRFAEGLAHHDLLFMRRDIRDPEALDAWLEDIDDGLVTTLLAESEGEIIGYATLHRSALHWSRHVAELRVVVAEDHRGRGLGRRLTEEAFLLALAEGLEKIVARMTVDQKGAIATFEGLGFKAEAILKDHVKDLENESHDLLVMSHSVADFGRMLDAYGVTDSLD